MSSTAAAAGGARTVARRPAEPAGLLDRIELLDPAECRELADRVEKLRGAFTQRGHAGCYTLGRASYADAARGADPSRDYYPHVAAANSLLRAHFGDLLDGVRACLSAYLGESADYARDLALPGFHIFEGPSITVGDRGVAHFDLQHRYVRWSTPPNARGLISFTLPVMLPREGGGLDAWDVTSANFNRAAAGQGVAEWTRERAPVRTQYSIGSLYVQPRMILHRIAGVPCVHDGDRRITLQGHGARVNGTWILYW